MPTMELFFSMKSARCPYLPRPSYFVFCNLKRFTA